MKNIRLFIIIFICSLFSYAQVEVINNKDYESAKFNSYELLNLDLKNKKIIGLGESSHYMRNTYKTKIKLIKYLHENLGYDVIAFEAPMYNLVKVNDSAKLGKANVELFKSNNAGVWYVDELDELYNYVIESYKTDRPLNYVGFDESFYKSEIFIKELKEYLDSKKIDIDPLYYNAVNNVINNSFSYKKPLPSDTLIIFNTNKLIRENLLDKTYQDRFWGKMMKNIQSVYGKNYNTSSRDKEMAENIKFISEVMYPNKKIILWAATIHLIDNSKNVEKEYKNLSLRSGYYLSNFYKDDYFILGIIPYEGKIGFKGYLGIMKRNIRSPKNSFEYSINEEFNCDYAYVSLNDYKFKDKPFYSNILSAKQTKTKLSNVVDGIFYIREEKMMNE